MSIEPGSLHGRRPIPTSADDEVSQADQDAAIIAEVSHTSAADFKKKYRGISPEAAANGPVPVSGKLRCRH